MKRVYFLFPFLLVMLFIIKASAQRLYTGEEGLEIGKLVKQTTEYKEAVRKADEFNADTTKIPQEVVFIVERKPVETGNIIIGTLKRKFVLAQRLDKSRKSRPDGGSYNYCL